MPDEAKPSSDSRRRVIVRILALGLMLAGLLISLYGQVIEVKSFREGPSSIESGIARGRERELAADLKNAGVVLVLSGPVVWLLGNWLAKQRNANVS